MTDAEFETLLGEMVESANSIRETIQRMVKILTTIEENRAELSAGVCLKGLRAVIFLSSLTVAAAVEVPASIVLSEAAVSMMEVEGVGIIGVLSGLLDGSDDKPTDILSQ